MNRKHTAKDDLRFKLERRILHVIDLLKLMKFNEGRWTLKCVLAGYKEMFPLRTGVKPYHYTIPKNQATAELKVNLLLLEIIDILNSWREKFADDELEGTGFFYQAPEYWCGDPKGGEA